MLEGPGLDFLDLGVTAPSHRIPQHRFARTLQMLKYMGLDLEKSEDAKAELRQKGIEA